MGLPLIFGVLAAGGGGYAYRDKLIATWNNVLRGNPEGTGEVDLKGAFDRATDVTKTTCNITKDAVSKVGDVLDGTRKVADTVVEVAKSDNPGAEIASKIAEGITGNSNIPDGIIDPRITAALGNEGGGINWAGPATIAGIGGALAFLSKMTIGTDFSNPKLAIAVALAAFAAYNVDFIKDKTLDLKDKASNLFEGGENSLSSMTTAGISVPSGDMDYDEYTP